jgi:organic hydroperoxide reductase OsmC/OhrA
MLSVTLRPNVRFCGERVPARADIMQLHERAHEECFIANSVLTEVVVESATAAGAKAGT